MQFSFCLALHSINHYQFQQSFSTSPSEPQNLSRSPSVIIILPFLMDQRPFFSTQCFSIGRTTHQKCLFPRDPIIDGSLDPCKSTSQTAYLWLSYFCRAHGHRHTHKHTGNKSNNSNSHLRCACNVAQNNQSLLK